MTIKALKEKTQGLSVLYVEDNETLTSIKLEMFHDIFARVVHAKDGYEALMTYQDESFDLIITDINMPRMDGLEMIEKMKKINPQQDVVVLSAYGEYEYHTRLETLEINCFLTKPVEIKKLMENIIKSCNRKEMV